MDSHHQKTELTPLQKAVIALKEARNKIEALERQKNEPIAIIGMGCRFPGVQIVQRRFGSYYQGEKK